MKRREAVQLLAVAPLAATFRLTPAAVREASALARQALARGTPYEPKNFTAHEWETVRLLVDLIIPKDERSGSATDAGVPEFMDFMLGDDPDLQTPVRGGLSYREAHLALELVAESGLLGSFEIVEVNPILDRGNETAALAVELAASAFGARIL